MVFSFRCRFFVSSWLFFFVSPWQFQITVLTLIFLWHFWGTVHLIVIQLFSRVWNSICCKNDFLGKLTRCCPFQESGIGVVFERLKCLIFRIMKGHFSQVSVAINIIYINKNCSVSFLRYWNVRYFGNWNKSFSKIWIVLVSGDWIELNVLFSINKAVSYSRDGNMLVLAD